MSRRSAIGLLVLTALACPLATARAQFATSEVRDLRVTEVSGAVLLTWNPPLDGADSYVVRRCELGTEEATSGRCIAENVTATSHVDAEETGDVFYIVTAVRRLLERTPGTGWNGREFFERPLAACDEGPDQTPFGVVIDLSEARDICGLEVFVELPSTFELVGMTCVDVLADYGENFNLADDGLLRATCTPANPDVEVRSPGDLIRFEVRRGECPAPDETITLESCEIVPACAEGRLELVPCGLRVE